MKEKQYEIKNKKEISDQPYKIYKDRTLISEHIKIQLLPDKKLITMIQNLLVWNFNKHHLQLIERKLIVL